MSNYNTMVNDVLNEYSVSYTADGINNNFYFPFHELYMDHIQVFVNSVLQYPFDSRAGYSVKAPYTVQGGFITFNNIPKAGSKILICENVAFKKIVNFFASSSFTAKDLNAEFDNIYKILGILNANSIKTLRIYNSDSVQDLADLQDGVIMKNGKDVITKNFDVDNIMAKLDDVSHKYDDIKVLLITAFNKLSSSGGGTVIKNALVSQNNLNDVIDIKEARKNLGLGDVATLNQITSAQVDDSLVKQNLANISDTALARQNLGLSDLATVSQADLIVLIDQKINDGFTVPVISVGIYSVNKDIDMKVDLHSDSYQQIQIASHTFLSSQQDLLFVDDNNYSMHIGVSGTYTINGFISMHGAYNVVAKIEARQQSDSALVDSFVSNHINSNLKYSSPGVCMFNEILIVNEPVTLRLFLMGDNSKNSSLMLDSPLDTDYVGKFTIQKILN